MVQTPIVYTNSSSLLTLIGGAMTSGSARGGQINLYSGGYSSVPERGGITFHTGVALGGTQQPERMRIDASGHVGIGTSSPTTVLHVNNDSSATPATVTTYTLRVAQNSSEMGIGGDSTASFVQSFNAKPLLLNSIGNPVLIASNSTSGVGIGPVTNPQTALHIGTPTGGGGITMQYTGAYSASSGTYVRFTNNGTPAAANLRLGGLVWGSTPSGTTVRNSAMIEGWSEAAWTDGTAYPTYLRFLTAPASGSSIPLERMRITAGGNVGIGTITPTNTLHVGGTARVTGTADVGDNSFIRGGSTGVANLAGLRFMENNATTRKGYVGDGSSTNSDIYLISDSGGVRLLPAAVNGVNGSLFVQGDLLYFNGGRMTFNNGTSNFIDFSATGTAAPTFTNRSAGTKIVLWTSLSATQSDYAMGVEANHIWSSVPTTGSGFKWYAGTIQVARLDGLGNLTLSGQSQATSFVQTSLRSLKKDIMPFDRSALAILEKAQVRTFKFKADPEAHTNIGFIADEVPDEMAPPKRNGVDQASTVALLVKAVQELAAQNKALQQELEAVKQQLKEKGTRLP